MNKVNWLELGGAPLRNDDWDFEAQAVRDALKGLASVLGANALLSGCVPSPSGGGTVFTEGYVLLSGEVCYVPAVVSPIVFDEDNNYFKLVESDVSLDGEVVMENGNNANIYKRRVANLVYDAGGIPPNSVDWLTAYNNRFNAKALAAVVNEIIFLQKGMFWKRLPGSLNIVSGTVVFSSNSGNFSVINTADSTLQSINLSTSGGGQPFFFALKIAGTGWLKVEHGSIKCNSQRDHYFKPGDIMLFVNDGAVGGDQTHLVSVGDSDVWHDVTVYGDGIAPLLGGVRYKKEDSFLVIDGAVQVTDHSLFVAGSKIFTIPILPAKMNRVVVGFFSATDTPPTHSEVCTVDGAGVWAALKIFANGDAYYFNTVRIALD